MADEVDESIIKFDGSITDESTIVNIYNFIYIYIYIYIV